MAFRRPVCVAGRLLLIPFVDTTGVSSMLARSVLSGAVRHCQFGNVHGDRSRAGGAGLSLGFS